jgi:hypothetical protein
MTVYHYFKICKSVNLENFKTFESFFKWSLKNHQALWWNWLLWGPPQESKTQLPLLQRISSLELQASEIAAQINASQSSSNWTHLNINCSEETMWIRPSWLNCCKETTTKVKHGGGGVMVLCWWHCDLFRIQGTLYQHGYHSILQRYSIPSGLCLVGLLFDFQQDNDPINRTMTQSLWMKIILYMFNKIFFSEQLYRYKII